MDRKPNPLEAGLPRMKWGQRWKTDFILARPEYKVKTRLQAWRAFFSPLGAAPDQINPWFLRDGDHWYAKPVTNLVMAVRGLSSKNHKNAHQHMRRIPLFNTIIQVLRDWDIETVDRELSILQREPRNRSFADLAPLTVSLLKPLFRLCRMNTHVHLLPALAKMYESAKMYLTNQEERDLLQRYYSIARDELPVVFTQVRNRFYPVLLKLLAERFIDEDQFYLEKEGQILAFLGLADDDLILDLPEATVEVEAPRVQPAWTFEADPIPGLAREGLERLDELFPRAGWKTLGTNPDLFAYYQTIFDFPKGSDLIPVDDPIQVIQPLSEVLQHLFYGFQNILWGTTAAENGDQVPLQEVLDKTIARWHFFHEEFFGKNYLPLLQEYCREVERAGPLSQEATRLEHQLLWFQRNYLLPNMILPIMDDVRVKNLGYPALPVQVREMIDLLARIAVDVERHGSRAASLRNPEARVRFPVANIVSQRFQAVNRRVEPGDLADNRTLLFYSLAILSTLDDLLSRPGSQLYQRQPKRLYRTSGDDKPVYNAPKKNSLGLLKKLNEQVPPPPDEARKTLKPASFYGSFLTKEDVRQGIDAYLTEKRPFSLVSVRTLYSGDEDRFRELLDPPLPSAPVFRRQDDGTWQGVMPGTTVQGAEAFLRELLGEAAGRERPLALAALAVAFVAHWTEEKLLEIPTQGWAAAAAIQPQVLGIWNPEAQSLEFRSDVPTVRPPAPEPEPDFGPVPDPETP